MKIPASIGIGVRIPASIRIPVRIPASDTGFFGIRALSWVRASSSVRFSHWIDGCAILSSVVSRATDIRRGMLGFVV